MRNGRVTNSPPCKCLGDDTLALINRQCCTDCRRTIAVELPALKHWCLILENCCNYHTLMPVKCIMDSTIRICNLLDHASSGKDSILARMVERQGWVSSWGESAAQSAHLANGQTIGRATLGFPSATSKQRNSVVDAILIALKPSHTHLLV